MSVMHSRTINERWRRRRLPARLENRNVSHRIERTGEEIPMIVTDSF
jgi:hypothetical protein